MTSIGNEVWNLLSDMNDSKRKRLVSLIGCKDTARQEKVWDRIRVMEMAVVDRFLDFLLDPKYSALLQPAREVMIDTIAAAPEDPRDNQWSGTLIDVICSLHRVRATLPELVKTQEQEEAILRLTFALSGTYMTPNDAVAYGHDVELQAYAIRIRDSEIVELVSKFPQRWEQIADLMTESGLRTREQVESVLDGSVPLSLAIGTL